MRSGSDEHSRKIPSKGFLCVYLGDVDKIMAKWNRNTDISVYGRPTYTRKILEAKITSTLLAVAKSGSLPVDGLCVLVYDLGYNRLLFLRESVRFIHLITLCVFSV